MPTVVRIEIAGGEEEEGSNDLLAPAAALHAERPVASRRAASA